MKNLFIFGILLLIIAAEPACYKFNFPTAIDSSSNRTANATIKQLYDLHQWGSKEIISQPFIIEALVVANDKENNFYNSIVVQDSTAGITINISGTGLYTVFPVGTVWLVNLQGLTLGDYFQNLQIGLGFDTIYKTPNSIPIVLVTQYFSLKDTIDFIPKLVTEAQLNSSLQNQFIRLQNMEFNYKDTAKTFADAINKVNTSRVLKFCSGTSLSVRTSGYADFAGNIIPDNNGSIAGVLTVYKDDIQLVLNSINDVQFLAPRCQQSNAYSLINENFESFPFDFIFSGYGWTNQAVSGNSLYKILRLQNNNSVSITALNSGSTVETWLVSPTLTLPENTDIYFSFQSRCAFDNGAQLNVYVSENFNGDVKKSSWDKLNPQISKGFTNSLAPYFVSSGKIKLRSSLQGKNINIAFKYNGVEDILNPAINQTTTFYIDDVKVFTE